jgi:Cu(I)/Ag(I) efflux system membrane fusion protein
MKFFITFLTALIIGLGVGLWSAGSGQIQQWTPEALQPLLAKIGLDGTGSGSDADSREKEIMYWVAPMDANYQRDKPGKSPMGMDLVPVYKEEKKEPEILYWVAPMDANFKRDKPGKSPMGMDLVPVYGGGDEDDNAIRIDPAVVNNLGVRTAKVEVGPLWRRIDAVASISVDDTRVAHINLRTKGWIERMIVKSAGERVKKGDLLFELYAPDLINAQDEYVRALGSGNSSLIRASRERLIALGLEDQQINALRRSRKAQRLVKVFAPQDGIVSSLKVGEGMFVKPATTIMTLADLSRVWVLAEVFERQANWVAVGQPAEVRLPYLPGRVWDGRVEYIYPELNPKTRTLRVRLGFDNPDEALKPNMYGTAAIYGGAKKDVLSVPREALIRSGSGNRLVVARGEGRFESREVLIGIESGDWIEIVEGINAGEDVVVSAQFLIDSEASIKGSFIRLEAGGSEREQSQQPVQASGKVNRVMAAAKRINLSHDPIPALNWPVMTMDFEVAPGVIPDDLDEGETVDFTLEQRAGSGWIITAIQRRAATTQEATP